MKSYAEILEAYDNGRYHIAPFRKVSPSHVLFSICSDASINPNDKDI